MLRGDEREMHLIHVLIASVFPIHVSNVEYFHCNPLVYLDFPLGQTDDRVTRCMTGAAKCRLTLSPFFLACSRGRNECRKCDVFSHLYSIEYSKFHIP